MMQHVQHKNQKLHLQAALKDEKCFNKNQPGTQNTQLVKTMSLH